MKPRLSSSTSGTQQPQHLGPYRIHQLSVSERIYRLLGVSASFDSAQAYVTSPIFSARILAAIRLALALYTLVALVFALAWDAERLHDAESYVSCLSCCVSMMSVEMILILIILICRLLLWNGRERGYVGQLNSYSALGVTAMGWILSSSRFGTDKT